MQFVLLAVIVAALLYMSRYFPKVAFSVLGVLILGAIAIVFTTTDFAQNSRSRIPIEDISIENPVMTDAYGGGFRFSARLNNNNQTVELKESIISITMLDCPDETEQGCTVIGQSEQRVNIIVPPTQARDVSRTLSFNSAKPAGIIRWQFRVTQTRS
jgi:hypothetical protein